jgi:hypothetical protein
MVLSQPKKKAFFVGSQQMLKKAPKQAAVGVLCKTALRDQAETWTCRSKHILDDLLEVGIVCGLSRFGLCFCSLFFQAALPTGQTTAPRLASPRVTANPQMHGGVTSHLRDKCVSFGHHNTPTAAFFSICCEPTKNVFF